MTMAPMSVADLADRIAAVTGNGPAFHARQIRAQVKEGALVPYGRGGSGLTAPALFDEAALCRAMVLHTLAALGIEMPLLRRASAALSVTDPRTRRGDTLETSVGIELAMSRIRAGERMYFHLDFDHWPDGDSLGASGWVSHLSDPMEDMPSRMMIASVVMPLHVVLKPLL